MAAVEAGIKTFLIADVRGYTRFTQERGDEAAALLATRFAELAREAIEAAGGSLVELRGDEALAVFDSARQALRGAADLQERFVGETVADPSLPLAVGIGLDAGEAVRVDGGYRGGALNLAARLCSLAGPGEVLVSPSVAHLARKVDGLDYVERGAVRLKGLEKPVDVVAVRPEREDAARELAFRRALDPASLRSRSPSTARRSPRRAARAAAPGFGRPRRCNSWAPTSPAVKASGGTSRTRPTAATSSLSSATARPTAGRSRSRLGKTRPARSPAATSRAKSGAVSSAGAATRASVRSSRRAARPRPGRRRRRARRAPRGPARSGRRRSACRAPCSERPRCRAGAA